MSEQAKPAEVPAVPPVDKPADAAAAPAPVAVQAAPAATPAAPAAPQLGARYVTDADFKAAEARALEKAKADLAAESQKRWQEAGFTSEEAALKWSAALRKAEEAAQKAVAPATPAAPGVAATPAAPAPAAPADAPKDPKLSVAEAELAAERAKAQALTNELAAARREREEVAAQARLEGAAVKEGVTDPEYAVTLLRRHLANSDVAQLKKDGFTEAGFFQGLKKTHPALFPVATVGATTTAPAAASPVAPTTAQQGSAGKFNAMTATPAELAAYLDDMKTRAQREKNN